MRACVLRSVGELCYQEVETPKPRRDEALLRIRRCGICSSDVDRVFKTGTYHFPTIPGHEMSGTVEAVGEDVDKSIIGRNAVVFPLLPCFRCPSCTAGEYACCDNYNYFGSRCDGGFAEYIAVPLWNLVFFPDGMSHDIAALCEPASVALHAVNKATIKSKDSVAIVGGGTIGILTALWAKIQGAGKVILIGHGQSKLEMAGALGVEYVINAETQDPEQRVLSLTDRRGADIVLEMAGNETAVRTALCCVKKQGTVVLTGNPSGDIALQRDIYWRILRRELSIKGTWNSKYGEDKGEWAVTLKHMSDGSLPADRLITHQFDLSKVESAFATMRDKKSGALKVMLRIRD